MNPAKKAIRKMLDKRTISQLEAEWKQELRPALAAAEAALVAHDAKAVELRIARANVNEQINTVRRRIDDIRREQAVAEDRKRELSMLREKIPALESKRKESHDLRLPESVASLTRDLAAATARRDQLAAMA